jgi:hypothetical protein
MFAGILGQVCLTAVLLDLTRLATRQRRTNKNASLTRDDDEDVIEVARFLLAHGVDLEAPCPGFLRDSLTQPPPSLWHWWLNILEEHRPPGSDADTFQRITEVMLGTDATTALREDFLDCFESAEYIRFDERLDRWKKSKRSSYWNPFSWS